MPFFNLLIVLPCFSGVKLNVDEGDIISAYKFFLQNVGIGQSDTEIGISASKYFNGMLI